MTRKRKLRPEETAIWRKVARTAKPLDETRRKSLEEPQEPAGADAENPPEPRPIRVDPIKPAGRKPPQPVDRTGERRHRRGKLEIEARIDLHGLTQDSAKGALNSFLHTAYAHGMRVVLVITGKGLKSHARDAEPWEYVEEPGVLRRRLPEWLAAPDLRKIVSGFSAAHQKHGGDGAFYITLRAR